MNRYTLHVGMIVDAEHELKQQLESLGRDDILNAYCDGDSFMVWGESFPQDRGDYPHGQVVFEAAHNHAARWIAIEILYHLLKQEHRYVSLHASCGNNRYAPYAVTHTDNWERNVL